MILRKLAVALAVAALPTSLSAQPIPAEALYAAAGDTGDTAWIMAATALVLLAALPGLGLFFGGRAAWKNFLSVSTQLGAVASIVSLLWIICGYTVAFGAVTNGWLGAGNAWMLIQLGNVRDGLAIPESGFVLFQMALAMLAVALLVGAWVGRARFAWVLVFCALWSLVVYAPVAHWVWGGGWLARLGTLDFAGGIVIETTVGVTALVISLLLGKREDFATRATSPHAPGFTVVGGLLVWVGWFGVTGGSAFAATDDATTAIINTHAAAASAALFWALLEKLMLGKPSAVGFVMGAIAGLAAVTPAAGYISPGAAIVYGLLATGVCAVTLRFVRKMKIDDALGIFAIHGMGGIVGTFLLAVFVNPDLGGTGYPDGLSFLTSLAAQSVGIVAVAIWSAIASAILAVGVSILWPMRVHDNEEEEGLDLATHGESSWEVN